MSFLYKKDIIPVDDKTLNELKSLQIYGAYFFITLFIRDCKKDPLERSFLEAIFSHHFSMHVINVSRIFNYLEDKRLLKFSS